jgi:hypothetical protein
MKPVILSATDAARGFGDLLARVRYRRESFLIRRGRTIVARLEPVDPPGVSGSEAAAAWGRHPRMGAQEAGDLAKDLTKARKAAAKPPRSPWER